MDDSSEATVVLPQTRVTSQLSVMIKGENYIFLQNPFSPNARNATRNDASNPKRRTNSVYRSASSRSRNSNRMRGRESFFPDHRSSKKRRRDQYSTSGDASLRSNHVYAELLAEDTNETVAGNREGRHLTKDSSSRTMVTRRKGVDESVNKRGKKKKTIKAKSDQTTVSCCYCRESGHNVTHCHVRTRDEQGIWDDDSDEHHGDDAYLSDDVSRDVANNRRAGTGTSQFFGDENENIGLANGDELQLPPIISQSTPHASQGPPENDEHVSVLQIMPKKNRKKYGGKLGEILDDFTVDPPVQYMMVDDNVEQNDSINNSIYVEGPINHHQLLQEKGAFAKLSKAHNRTISGFTAPNLIQSQQDPLLGHSFISGGKKYVSLNYLAATVAENNKAKAAKTMEQRKRSNAREVLAKNKRNKIGDSVEGRKGSKTKDCAAAKKGNRSKGHKK